MLPPRLRSHRSSSPPPNSTHLPPPLSPLVSSPHSPTFPPSPRWIFLEPPPPKRRRRRGASFVAIIQGPRVRDTISKYSLCRDEREKEKLIALQVHVHCAMCMHGHFSPSLAKRSKTRRNKNHFPIQMPP